MSKQVDPMGPPRVAKSINQAGSSSIQGNTGTITEFHHTTDVETKVTAARLERKKQKKKERKRLNKQKQLEAADSKISAAPPADAQPGPINRIVENNTADSGSSKQSVVRTVVMPVVWSNGCHESGTGNMQERSRPTVPPVVPPRTDVKSLPAISKLPSSTAAERKIMYQSSSSSRVNRGHDLYTSLNEVIDGVFCNVIGLVTGHSGVRTTRTGEFCLTLQLKDPSLSGNFNTINCFQRTNQTWLPQAKIGDILVLHNAKVYLHSLLICD
jgi:hypothetical protein